MFSKLGIYTLLAGLFMGLFSGISSFMNADNFWVDLTLSKVLGEERSESIIETFSSEFIQNKLDTIIYDAPAFLLVLFLSVVLLIIGMFKREH